MEWKPTEGLVVTGIYFSAGCLRYALGTGDKKKIRLSPELSVNAPNFDLPDLEIHNSFNGKEQLNSRSLMLTPKHTIGQKAIAV